MLDMYIVCYHVFKRWKRITKTETNKNETRKTKQKWETPPKFNKIKQKKKKQQHLKKCFKIVNEKKLKLFHQQQEKKLLLTGFYLNTYIDFMEGFRGKFLKVPLPKY